MNIRAVLIDLSGTLHVGQEAIPGAVDALVRLRAAGIPCRFVSNTSTKNPFPSVSRLGFDIRKEEVFTSLAAVRSLIETRGLVPYLIAEPEALAEFEGLPGLSPGSGEGRSGGTDEPERPRENAVVVCLAPSQLTYERLNRAFRVLEGTAGAQLIAAHRGTHLRDGADGGLSLGPGPFVLALEEASGVRAETVGKPTRAFFERALASIAGAELGGAGGGGDAGAPPPICPSEAVMIGDDVRDDVGGAQAAGLRGILVRTGKYREGDESNGGVTPDYVADDFAAAVDWVLAQRG